MWCPPGSDDGARGYCPHDGADEEFGRSCVVDELDSHRRVRVTERSAMRTPYSACRPTPSRLRSLCRTRHAPRVRLTWRLLTGLARVGDRGLALVLRAGGIEPSRERMAFVDVAVSM